MEAPNPPGLMGLWRRGPWGNHGLDNLTCEKLSKEASKRALSSRWRCFSEKLRGSLKRDKIQTCLAGSTRTHLLVTLPKFCRNSHEAFKIPLHDAHASGNHRLPQGACVQGYAAGGKQGSQGRAVHTRLPVQGLGLKMQKLS